MILEGPQSPGSAGIQRWKETPSEGQDTQGIFCRILTREEEARRGIEKRKQEEEERRGREKKKQKEEEKRNCKVLSERPWEAFQRTQVLRCCPASCWWMRRGGGDNGEKVSFVYRSYYLHSPPADRIRMGVDFVSQTLPRNNMKTIIPIRATERAHLLPSSDWEIHWVWIQIFYGGCIFIYLSYKGIFPTWIMDWLMNCINSPYFYEQLKLRIGEKN